MHIIIISSEARGQAHTLGGNEMTTTTTATHYSITHNSWGDITTKWFDSKAQAKAYAKSIVRLGYAPEIVAYDSTAEGYQNPRGNYFDLGYIAWALINQTWWARS
jgi:hypothetical protein